MAQIQVDLLDLLLSKPGEGQKFQLACFSVRIMSSNQWFQIMRNTVSQWFTICERCLPGSHGSQQGNLMWLASQKNLEPLLYLNHTQASLLKNKWTKYWHTIIFVWRLYHNYSNSECVSRPYLTILWCPGTDCQPRFQSLTFCYRNMYYNGDAGNHILNGFNKKGTPESNHFN